MKRIAAIFLLISFLLQAFTGAALVGSFYLNNESYAQNCINKSRPQMHCNGKCQLMKQLKRQEKQDKQTVRFTGKGQVLSSRSFFATANTPLFYTNLLYNLYHSPLPIDMASKIFHPPGRYRA